MPNVKIKDYDKIKITPEMESIIDTKIKDSVEEQYVPIHLHTPNSLLDGFCQIDHLLNHALEKGIPALAITDHGVCSGHVEFYKKSLSVGIKPILGCEIYMTPNRFEKEELFKKESISYDAKGKQRVRVTKKKNHLLVIARNAEGYKNLMRMTSIAQTEGFYGKPRVDYELVQKYGKGCIATSACLGSDINQFLLEKNDEMAIGMIKFYDQCFDKFYLELQPSHSKEQLYVNARLQEIAKEINLPLIVSTDAHMISIEDREAHKSLTSISKNNDDSESDHSVYNHCYIQSYEELIEFGIPMEAIQNTLELTDLVDFKMEIGEIKYPEFIVPEGFDFDSYMTELANRGFMNRMFNGQFYNDDISIDDYKNQLDYEISVVKEKNLSAYMLIVEDYISYARSQNILVGPGRGSAAGSLLSYCLGITNLDPMKYELLFERFINPERPSFPDVDTDFSYLERHKVIEYITEKYGADKVAQIGTYTTLSTKSALKDIGRLLGIDHNIINDINKFVPSIQGKTPSIEECLETIPEFEEFNKMYPDLFEKAIEIEKFPRSASVHACFTPDTVILTHNGYKRIDEVQVGDFVKTSDGSFKPVINTMVSKHDGYFKLKGTSNLEVKASGNHPFYVYNIQSKKYEWIALEDLDKEVHQLVKHAPLQNKRKLDKKHIFLAQLIGIYIQFGKNHSFFRNIKEVTRQVSIEVPVKAKIDLKDFVESVLNNADIKYECMEKKAHYQFFIEEKSTVEYLTNLSSWDFESARDGLNLTKEFFEKDQEFILEIASTILKISGIVDSTKNETIFVMASNNPRIVSQYLDLFEIAFDFARIKFDPARNEFLIIPRTKGINGVTSSYSYHHMYIQRKEYVKGDIDLYNLTVQDNPSYTANRYIVHNCGIEIAPEPIYESVPLMIGKSSKNKEAAVVTQYEGPMLEHLGYIKFDFLGLKNLSVIDLCLKYANLKIDIDALDPFSDTKENKKAFKLIQEGKTVGVFQLESDGMQSLFKGLDKVDILSLIAGVALYR